MYANFPDWTCIFHPVVGTSYHGTKGRNKAATPSMTRNPALKNARFRFYFVNLPSRRLTCYWGWLSIQRLSGFYGKGKNGAA